MERVPADAVVSGVGRKPFSLSSVAFTSTIRRIVRLLALTGLIGLAWERRTGFSDAGIVLQIFFGGSVNPPKGRKERGGLHATVPGGLGAISSREAGAM
jgi:hypothetical protein